jgi:hypothetical protein
MIKGFIALALVTAACTTDPPDKTRSAFQITETDTRIEIDATELRGQVVVENGRFEIPETDGVIAEGRKLTVKLGELQVEHVSAGYPDLHLPLLSGGNDGLNVLLTAPEVAVPLGRWGVHFRSDMPTGPTGITAPPLSASAETPYVTCRAVNSGTSSPFVGCGTCTFATTASCKATGCRQFPGAGGEAQQFVTCDSDIFIAQRACTTPLGSTSCGNAGPNGCAVCWRIRIFDFAELDGSGGTCGWRNCKAACGGEAC